VRSQNLSSRKQAEAEAITTMKRSQTSTTPTSFDARGVLKTSKERVMLFGVPIATFVLVLLILQNASHTLLMRYSRGILREEYSLKSAVLMMELLKMVTSMVLIARQQPSTRLPGESVWNTYTRLTRSSLVMVVPAALYFFQKYVVLCVNCAILLLRLRRAHESHVRSFIHSLWCNWNTTVKCSSSACRTWMRRRTRFCRRVGLHRIARRFFREDAEAETIRCRCT
jgi:hypothetical protein